MHTRAYWDHVLWIRCLKGSQLYDHLVTISSCVLAPIGIHYDEAEISLSFFLFNPLSWKFFNPLHCQQLSHQNNCGVLVLFGRPSLLIFHDRNHLSRNFPVVCCSGTQVLWNSPWQIRCLFTQGNCDANTSCHYGSCCMHGNLWQKFLSILIA